MPHTGLTATFDDPDAFAASVHNCSATLVPLQRGRFAARIALARLPEMSLCLAAEDLPRRATISFAPDRFFLRLVAPWDRGRVRAGVADVPGTIECKVGEIGVEDVIAQPIVSRSLSVPMACMLSRAEILFDEPPPFLFRCSAPLRPLPQTILRLVAMHREMMRIAVDPGVVDESRINAMQGAMWDALAEAMMQLPVAGDATPQHRGQAIMRRVMDYITAHEDRPIALTELCATAGCSAKSLQTLFLRIMGETPNRYMRRWRLWRTREALAAADPASANVSSIAVSFGFWELGRFSVAYRAMFGESPSQTLRGRAHPPRTPEKYRVTISA
jgi:AraC-like DNA-binding protein